MKKTWIKVKRGLLEPKHIERLGVRFFLYLYYLDQADWVEGAVLFYRDRDAADELGIPIPTVRKQRVKLEEDKYISCLQKNDHQVITIHNWTNPREYSGEIYNKSNQKGAPLTDDDDESNHKGNHKGNATMVTPSLYSHITSHIKDKELLPKETEQLFIGAIKTLVGGDISEFYKEQIEDAPKILEDGCIKLIIDDENIRIGLNKKAMLINQHIFSKMVSNGVFNKFECISSADMEAL